MAASLLLLWEAKCFGVKTGMRVREGKMLCPGLIVLPSDPWKYRYVNRKFLAILREYSSDVEVKSIDEMVLMLEKSPAIVRRSMYGHNQALLAIGQEIKLRIKKEVGDWLTVSVGFAPNRFLAKTAAGLHKPDGLDIIDRENVEEILFTMHLEDLCGIKGGNGGRLRRSGISSAIAFYQATPGQLERAFHSIVGHHWWMRLHGWEIDDRDFGRKSFGHSYALYKPYKPSEKPLVQILDQLVEKMGRRLRAGGYTSQGMHVSCFYSDSSYWHHGEKLKQPIYANRDLYEYALHVLCKAPDKPVRILAVSCFALSAILYQQQSLYEDEKKKERLTQALDRLADRWGDFVVTSGRMLSMETKVLDRIAFGGVAALEEFMFQEPIDNEPEYI